MRWRGAPSRDPAGHRVGIGTPAGARAAPARSTAFGGTFGHQERPARPSQLRFPRKFAGSLPGAPQCVTLCACFGRSWAGDANLGAGFMPNFQLIDARAEMLALRHLQALREVLGERTDRNGPVAANRLLEQALIVLTESLSYTAAQAWRISARAHAKLAERPASRRRFRASSRARFQAAPRCVTYARAPGRS